MIFYVVTASCEAPGNLVRGLFYSPQEAFEHVQFYNSDVEELLGTEASSLGFALRQVTHEVWMVDVTNSASEPGDGSVPTYPGLFQIWTAQAQPLVTDTGRTDDRSRPYDEEKRADAKVEKQMRTWSDKKLGTQALIHDNQALFAFELLERSSRLGLMFRAELERRRLVFDCNGKFVREEPPSVASAQERLAPLSSEPFPKRKRFMH